MAFWVLVAVAGIRYVLPKWRDFALSSRLSSIDPVWLASASLVLVLQYLVVFRLWRRVLEVLGAAAPASLLYRAFGLSLLPKYVPGKLLGPGLRTRLTVSAGIPYPVAVGSLFWEIGLSLAAAIAITAAGIAAGMSHEFDPVARWLAIAVMAIAGAMLAASTVPRARTLLATWLHFPAAWRRPGAVAGLFLGYLGGWLMYGAAHWMLARALGPFPASQSVPLLVSLAASWTLGVLSLFAPGGLGVREGILFLFARGPMGAPSALLFVTLSRLLMFLVEVLLTVSALAAVPRQPVALTPTDLSGS
jgi:hypothetical protein